MLYATCGRATIMESLKQPGQGRNGEIELWRIIVACAIVFHHSYNLAWPGIVCGGYVGVEFFFLLSGYLLARHIRKQAGGVQPPASSLGGETLAYLWRRLRSFWPELLVSCLIGLAVHAWGHHFAVRSTLAMARDTVLGNLMLLDMTGLSGTGINPPAWYLSTLMVGSALLYPLLKRHGHSVLVPIAACFLLGYIMVADSDSPRMGFAMVRNWMGWAYKGNIRGVAELAIGASLYPLVQVLASRRAPQWARACLTLVKWGCYGVMLLYCVHPVGTWMPLVLAALACALVLNASGVCADAGWYRHGWIMRLGRFSLPLYLSHIFWAKNLAAIAPGIPADSALMLALYFAVSVATALVVELLAKCLRRISTASPDIAG